MQFNTATVAISTNTVALPVSITTSTNVTCAGTPATLTASGANTYTWSTGSTNTTVVVSPTMSTGYYATGMNSVNGCTATSSIITLTVNGLPVVTASSDNPIICGPPFQGTATLNAFGAFTYTWNTSATTASISVSPSVTTSYTVSGTNGYGCIGSFVITQSVSTCTGVDASEAGRPELSVFPNLTSGVFKISYAGDDTGPEVYNSVGERIFLPVRSTGNSIEMDLSRQTDGMYFIIMRNHAKHAISRIVKRN